METLGSDPPPPTDLSFSLIAHLLAKMHRTWNLTVPYFPGCKLFEHPYMSASKSMAASRRATKDAIYYRPLWR